MSFQQKLVTVFLHDNANGTGAAYGAPDGGDFYGVKEHLTEYIDDDWSVKELQVLGGVGGCLSGLIVVLLEKSAD